MHFPYHLLFIIFLNLLVEKERNNLAYEHYLSSYVNVFGEQLPENTKRHNYDAKWSLTSQPSDVCACVTSGKPGIPAIFIHPANQALHVRYVISVQRRHI